mmetsp:Transcript_34173/g.54734  ORF Transcript_34173/g.54734 Transcript_34173/m.54734 type:complete len:261 (+) Transcript_34173:396-1178(+)|eukprot:CAMPEP_0203752618 /NCGR_PEP_ID=MMETSP0098-20131031/6516_1 /ASSEMBLY_ACC=CAM_ASM_000208 /TAXON_ID=96639 /ORGANISM=" , Strain NY0313808BC1" /LENGTH=260 /DNA_ID=CAMNT_0050642861 /DNA_START=370 /DNA_END=1152 /DNA_ORIENTATION=+
MSWHNGVGSSSKNIADSGDRQFTNSNSFSLSSRSIGDPRPDGPCVASFRLKPSETADTSKSASATATSADVKPGDFIVQEESNTGASAPSLNFEKSLDRIRVADGKEEMSAFGSDRNRVIGLVDEIRKQQIDIFRRQMKLEVSLSMDENEEENDQQIFSSEGFSEKFQEKFKKKEKALDSIRGLLENLTTQLKEVNDATTEKNMPRNPGLEENENSSTVNNQPARAYQTSRNLSTDTGKKKSDACDGVKQEWMSQLELGG